MIGIDLGSRSVKIVQMRAGKIIRHAVYDTISFYKEFGSTGKDGLKLDLLGLGFENDNLIATGYGKITVQIEGAIHLPEIQAHAMGAVFQSGLSDFTLLDIGGQDTKVIKIRDSQVVDFITNDRCAASSGRYMENMASVLGIELAELSLYSENPVELNSTCAIFGETEIIGRIIEGYSIPQLAAGVNHSLYKRFANYLKKLQSNIILVSGGVAKNDAVLRIIANKTDIEVKKLFEPQLNGAIGCCVYGRN